MSLPWSVKYQPPRLSGMVGNKENIAELVKFISTYKRGGKGFALEGPTGTGKTAAVIALAAELDLELVEMNASDVRNEKGISSTAGQASKQMSLFAKGKIILLDEADSVSVTKDRGAPSAIADLIEQSAFPVILTATNLDESKFSAIRKKVKRLSWKQPNSDEIAIVLERIAKEESLDIEKDVFKSLALRSNGDIRAAVTDLQILATKKKITKADLDSLGERNTHSALKTLLIKVFKNSDPKIALQAMDEANEDPDEAMLWIDENLPYEYRVKDLSDAYDFLSRADVYKGRIRKQQHWRYLVYIIAFMTAGVAISKTKKNPAMREYKRAERLLAIWIANNRGASRKQLAKALAPHLHASAKELFTIAMPYLKELARKDRNFATKLKERYKLEDEQIDYLEK